MNTNSAAVTPEEYVRLAKEAGWNTLVDQTGDSSLKWTFSSDIKCGDAVISPAFTVVSSADALYHTMADYAAKYNADKVVRDLIVAKYGSVDSAPFTLSDLGGTVNSLQESVLDLLAAMDCPQMEKDLAEWLADTHYRDAVPNSPGEYEDELYADYRDELSERQLKEVLESDAPGEQFYDLLTDMYEESRRAEEDRLEDEAVEAMEEMRGESLGDIRTEALRSFLREHFYFNVPAKHFLKQEFPVTVILDTGDGNSDFVLNTRFPHYDGTKEPMDEKASLVWLARQQGYSKAELESALDKGDMRGPQSFLESCRVELANASSSMLATVFMVRMTVEQILLLNALSKIGEKELRTSGEKKDLGHIVLGRQTTTGLFDLWGGAGGPLEIALEKDVVIPINIIRSAWPDGMDGCCSAREVYGMSEGAFTDSLQEICFPDELREEVSSLSA